MNPFTRQAGLTVLLLPIMFGLWYAGGQLLAAPAVWLTDFILSHVFSNAVDRAFLDGTNMTVVTWFGEINGQITSAEAAGYQLALNINTRLISYSMPFYAALLWASNVDNTLERFARGLIIIWAAMTLGLIAIAAKDLMIVVGPLFIEQTLVPHRDRSALPIQRITRTVTGTGRSLGLATQGLGPMGQAAKRVVCIAAKGLSDTAFGKGLAYSLSPSASAPIPNIAA